MPNLELPTLVGGTPEEQQQATEIRDKYAQSFYELANKPWTYQSRFKDTFINSIKYINQTSYWLTTGKAIADSHFVGLKDDMRAAMR